MTGWREGSRANSQANRFGTASHTGYTSGTNYALYAPKEFIILPTQSVESTRVEFMKLRIPVLALGALVLIGTTVSAAIMPWIPSNHEATVKQTTWTDLPIIQVTFPDNLDIDEEAVYVLKTQAQWDAFWAQVPDVTVDGKPVGEVAKPDFSHQFAVIASYAWKAEGFAISVTQARFNGNQIAVEVERQIPNPANCRVYFDPFYGGIAIVEQPEVADFTATPIGSHYEQTMEARWEHATRDCRNQNA